jgi:hypothetical protein
MGVLGLSGTPSSNPAEVAPYGASITGIVVNATWDELQPTGPTDLVAGDTLDQQMDAVRSYNTTHPATPLSVKIRVSAGFRAPSWAMALGGGPVTIPADPSAKNWRSGPIGEWWTSAYQSAWRDFQGKLAAKYDADPLVSEVAVTSCAFQTDEPWVIPAGQVALPALHAVGYDDMLEQQCLASALADYAAWKLTWIDYTFNDYHLTDSTPSSDPAFLLSVMEQCTTADNCILANHGLADDSPGTGGTDVYTEMLAQSSTSTVNFQTYAPNPGDWCAIITVAEKYHAASIELWPDFSGFTTLTPDQLANLATALANGTAPDPSRCPGATDGG